eukprot:800275-Amphidinium_carterae.3
MGKECQSWQKFGAAQLSQVPAGVEIIPTRWVSVYKSSTTRQHGERTPLKAKARLVVLGQRESAWFRSDAPAVGATSLNMLCSSAAVFRWPLCSADAANAFLQTSQSESSLQRLLYCFDHQLRLLLKRRDALCAQNHRSSIFGTRDALGSGGCTYVVPSSVWAGFHIALRVLSVDLVSTLPQHV